MQSAVPGISQPNVKDRTLDTVYKYCLISREESERKRDPNGVRRKFVDDTTAKAAVFLFFFFFFFFKTTSHFTIIIIIPKCQQFHPLPPFPYNPIPLSSYQIPLAKRSSSSSLHGKRRLHFTLFELWLNN